jgi:hypothetical protein
MMIFDSKEMHRFYDLASKNQFWIVAKYLKKYVH